MRDDGGPAFPFFRQYKDWSDCTTRESCDGMTLRDWFAGMALPFALAAEPPSTAIPMDAIAAGIQVRREHERPARIAAEAYRLADAMLAERSKP